MVIKVGDIPPEGMEVHFDREKGLKINERTKIELATPLHSVIRLKREQGKIHLTGEIHTAIWLSCARCLEPFHYLVDIKMDYLLVPRNKIPKAEGLRLKSGDMEVEFFDGIEIDIDHIINEQIFLSIPIKPLCHKDCAGLCPYCGANLNKERCNCKVPSFHPFYEALRRLKQ